MACRPTAHLARRRARGAGSGLDWLAPVFALLYLHNRIRDGGLHDAPPAGFSLAGRRS